MKMKGVIFSAVLVLFFFGCSLFQELLEPGDILTLIDNTSKDTTPPIITINSPADGSEVGQIYQITGTVLDDSSGVKKVTVLLDGSPFDVIITGETWTANISNLAYGIHTNTVIAGAF